MRNTVTKASTTAVIAGVLATGCVTTTGGGIGGMTEEQTKVLVGTVIGGVVGHQAGKGKGNKAATIAGALLGGYLGAMMSNESRQRTNYALESTPNNQAQTWVEPGTNNKYTVTPTKTYTTQTQQGQSAVCRDYKMDAYIDGRLEQVSGRACKNANGQWVNAT